MTVNEMLGENFLAFLTLALGGALALGNALALMKPRQEAGEGELTQAPKGRAAIQIVIGSVASIWAIATIAS